ncbi:MAG: hypothetical protein QXH10_09390 [Ignisphaera sp.]
MRCFKKGNKCLVAFIHRKYREIVFEGIGTNTLLLIKIYDDLSCIVTLSPKYESILCRISVLREKTTCDPSISITNLLMISLRSSPPIVPSRSMQTTLRFVVVNTSKTIPPAHPHPNTATSTSMSYHL